MLLLDTFDLIPFCLALAFTVIVLAIAMRRQPTPRKTRHQLWASFGSVLLILLAVGMAASLGLLHGNVGIAVLVGALIAGGVLAVRFERLRKRHASFKALKWKDWGAIALLFAVALFLSGRLLISREMDRPSYRFAMEYIGNDKKVLERIGEIRKSRLVSFGSSRFGAREECEYAIALRGEKGGGQVQITLQKTTDTWTVRDYRPSLSGR